MADPIPVRLTADDGIGTFSGTAVFPDPDNQPGAPPFVSGVGVDLILLEASDNSQLLAGGDDTGGVIATSHDGLSAIVVNNGGVSIQVNNGKNLGFFGTPPAAQPTVADATADAILAALVTLGLVIDGT